jgi:signal transduction histidine kinase
MSNLAHGEELREWRRTLPLQIWASIADVSTMQRSGRLARLGEVRYREPLDVPGIARAHNFQRVFSYGLGAVAVAALELDTWRVVVVGATCVVSVLVAARRLATGRQLAPLPAALIDLLLSTFVVAVATGSAGVTLLVALVVGAAVVGSFAVPARKGVLWVAGFSVASVGLAWLVAPEGARGSPPAVLAFVVVALLLVVAIVILIFFTYQSSRLRRSLSSREAELGAVMSVTPVVLATVAADGTVSAVAGEDTAWLGAPGDRVPSAMASLVERAAGGRVSDDLMVDGRVFSLTCAPGSGGSVLLTAFDITEREMTRRRLEDLLRSKDSFVAAISHELRTPLTAVLGFAEEAKEAIADDDPLKMPVEIIAEQSAELAAIIEDLLVAARTEHGAIALLAREVDLAEEARGVVASLRSRLIAQPELLVESAQVIGDPVRIRQILRNLVTNADRYGGSSVELRAFTRDGLGVVEVRDDGPELPPESRERIFEPYESSGPVRGEPAAMGLGLAVSRRLADLMGGELRYDHVDGWSVFRLALPAAGLRPETSGFQTSDSRT